MRTPEDVLEELEADVVSLRRRGFGEEADRMHKVTVAFRKALEPIALVSEQVAMTRSGRSARWLRERHDGWCLVGAADFDKKGGRLYRYCVLPTRLAGLKSTADA